MFVTLTFGVLCLTLTATAYNWNDPCNLMPQGPRNKTSTINVNVATSCHNGTFDWNYPQGTINLIFHNQNRLSMSVCLRDYLGGDVFTIHDITGGQFTPMEVFNGRLHGFANAKETCSPYHKTDITLQFKAPPTMYYMGEVAYRLKR